MAASRVNITTVSSYSYGLEPEDDYAATAGLLTFPDGFSLFLKRPLAFGGIFGQGKQRNLAFVKCHALLKRHGFSVPIDSSIEKDYS